MIATAVIHRLTAACRDLRAAAAVGEASASVAPHLAQQAAGITRALDDLEPLFTALAAELAPGAAATAGQPSPASETFPGPISVSVLWDQAPSVEQRLRARRVPFMRQNWDPGKGCSFVVLAQDEAALRDACLAAPRGAARREIW